MKNIYIDTDCGMDDLVAIAMLLRRNQNLIKGLSTVRGLTSPLIGKRNLKQITRYLNLSLPIYSGSNTALSKLGQKAAFPKQNITNSSRLAFLKDLFANKKISQSEKSYNFFKSIIQENQKVDILCLGPLTNIARAIYKYKSRFTQKVNRLVIMGGAVYSPGNVLPQRKSEYNFYLDPKAAKVVLSSGINILLIPTDATRLVPTTTEIAQKIRKAQPKSETGILIQKTLLANNNDFRYFYDPLAASILLDPSIVKTAQTVNIKVTSTGQTLPTIVSKSPIKVVVDIKPLKFYNMLLACLN